MKTLSEHAGDFFTQCQTDAPRRWSTADFAAQQQFVNEGVAGNEWADWSTPMAAMQLIQSSLLGVPLEETGRHEAIVIAGPVVELLPAADVFGMAAGRLKPAGRLVGVIPCLRDNSPESQMFMDLAADRLWPYCVAEELTERLGEAGFQQDGESGSGFAAVPQFVHAVLKDELAFKGFRGIFDEMEKQGYDPIEIGWGELRFSAALKETDKA